MNHTFSLWLYTNNTSSLSQLNIMLQHSFLCFSLCLLFLFLTTIPLGTSSNLREIPTVRSSFRKVGAMPTNDIIDQTCKKCANQSIILSYSLCSTSLQAIPVSHAANLQGLGLIAMELALENVTNTLATIEKLLSNTSYDNYEMACMEDCLELYSEAAWTIVNSLGAFLSGNYETSRTWMSSVMEAASTCQEGFEEKGVESPLTKENYDLFQLCGIALCIIHLSAYDVPS